MSRTIVRTENLTKIYGQDVQVYALDDVNLTVSHGEMVAVMGPSGSGKSTLLNMLGALDRPTSGRVVIDGQDLAKVRSLDAFRSRTVGFVFQMHNLIPTLTAIENVEVPLRGQGLSRRQQRERAQAMLALVSLSDRAKHLPSQLSGGQRQRVAVARALVNEPQIILADEPTGNLDSSSGHDIMELLVSLNRQHQTTILVVTHDRQVARYTSRILTMQDGRIADEHQVGSVIDEDLYDLAQSQLGRLLIAGDVSGLSGSPFVQDDRLTDAARALAQRLAQIIG